MKIPVLSYGEDVQIAEARLSNLTVSSFDPIRCTTTWKNKKILVPYYADHPGNISVAYALGNYNPATHGFTFLMFEVPGHVASPFIVGSTWVDEVPPRGETSIMDILSYAPGVPQTMVFDIFHYLAGGTMRVYTANYGYGTRWVGLSVEDFQRLWFRGLHIFPDAITVVP